MKTSRRVFARWAPPGDGLIECIEFLASSSFKLSVSRPDDLSSTSNSISQRILLRVSHPGSDSTMAHRVGHLLEQICISDISRASEISLLRFCEGRTACGSRCCIAANTSSRWVSIVCKLGELGARSSSAELPLSLAGPLCQLAR